VWSRESSTTWATWQGRPRLSTTAKSAYAAKPGGGPGQAKDPIHAGRNGVRPGSKRRQQDREDSQCLGGGNLNDGYITEAEASIRTKKKRESKRVVSMSPGGVVGEGAVANKDGKGLQAGTLLVRRVRWKKKGGEGQKGCTVRTVPEWGGWSVGHL